MKIFKLFIFFCLFISCSDKKVENKISEFDKALGVKNVSTLDFLVSDFENNFLKRQYPSFDKENAYRQFLIELRDNKFDQWKRISQKARQKFKSSDLRHEMYEYPDSVWIIENSTFDKIESDSLSFLESSFPYVKLRYKYNNPDGTLEYFYSRRYEMIKPNDNFDSIINQVLESPEINYIGKYLQALESIKDRNEFLNGFYEAKKSAGFLLPGWTSSMMLKYHIDLNDELNRKIIVLELAY